MNFTLYSTKAVRSEGAGSLDVSNFAEETIQKWIAFLSDGLNASNSIYIGDYLLCKNMFIPELLL